jgi:hypothetical protein
MLPGTELNVNTGVLMLWNGTSGNITQNNREYLNFSNSSLMVTVDQSWKKF